MDTHRQCVYKEREQKTHTRGTWWITSDLLIQRAIQLQRFLDTMTRHRVTHSRQLLTTNRRDCGKVATEETLRVWQLGDLLDWVMEPSDLNESVINRPLQTEHERPDANWQSLKYTGVEFAGSKFPALIRTMWLCCQAEERPQGLNSISFTIYRISFTICY